EQRRSLRLEQENVEIAVAVDIGVGRAASDDRLEQARAGLFGRDQGKAGAIIPEELGGLPIFLACLDLADFLFQMAVGGQQIQPAVEVVIEEEQTELQQ